MTKHIVKLEFKSWEDAREFMKTAPQVPMSYLAELDKKEKQKLKVNFSEEDLQDLLNGETFDWTFTTDKGEDIDIHLYNGYDDNDGNDCDKCGNPVKMYWCDNCESNQETSGECITCGHANGIKYVVVEDEDYHNDCN